MELKKVKGTFCDYTISCSWGQLNAIFQALEQDHADVMKDEMLAELSYYLQNTAGPGEDPEEYKAAKDAEKQSQDAGEEPQGRDQDLVGQEVQEVPEEDELGAEGGPEGAKSPAPKRKPETEEADHLLERPPRREAAGV